MHDPSEPFEKGALITTGTRTTEKPTDDRGTVLVGGLETFEPIPIGVDTSELKNPNLVPRKAIQVVTPRPGVPAEVEIGLVGGGDVEGAVVKNGGLGFEGLSLELVDSDGKVVATSQTDYDGYFLFERVAYGTYAVRVAAASAATAKVLADLQATAIVSEDKPVARLGSLSTTPLPKIASTDLESSQTTCTSCY